MEMKYQIRIFVTIEETKFTTWQVVNPEMKKHAKPVKAVSCSISAADCNVLAVILTVLQKHAKPVKAVSFSISAAIAM